MPAALSSSGDTTIAEEYRVELANLANQVRLYAVLGGGAGAPTDRSR